jgi:hypothetical protein
LLRLSNVDGRRIKYHYGEEWNDIYKEKRDYLWKNLPLCLPPIPDPHGMANGVPQ